MKNHYDKKIGKPYFQNLKFDNFEDYFDIVSKENLHTIIKEDPPVWFATIDKKRQVQNETMRLWEDENAVHTIRSKGNEYGH